MEKGQSKFRSLLEANTNTIVGFALTFIFSPLFYWIVGMEYTVKQLGVLTSLFTVLSVIRGYIIRRIFNKIEKEKDSELMKLVDRAKSEVQNAHEALINQEYINNQWSNLHKKMRARNFKLQQELDMCKHLHTAAVSDLVEGADYYHGYDKYEPQNINFKLEEPKKPEDADKL